MVHQYKLNGYNIVLDTVSGSVHTVDVVAYDIIEMYKSKSAEQIVEAILSKYSHLPDVTREDIMLCLQDIASLEEAGYNKSGGRTIPVFGIDATDAAKNKIKSGAMTGTVKQDAKGMAEVISQIAVNYTTGNEQFVSVEEDYIIGGWRVNIPYSLYTGEE